MNKLVSKVKFGYLYKYSGKLEGNQHYNLFVPVLRNNKLYMVDTYQIDTLGFKKAPFDTVYDTHVDLFTNKFSIDEDTYYAFSNGYYYKGRFEIETPADLNLFEEYINLNDYTYIPKNDKASLYNEKDIVEDIYLYHEDHYPCGRTLVKKGAKHDSWNTIETECANLLENFSGPTTGWHRIDDLQKLIDEADKNGDHYNSQRAKAVVKYYELIKEFETLFNQRYKDEIEEDLTNKHDSLEEDFIKDKTKKCKEVELGTIHNDVERYLREDCYCPNEVYDLNGFYYNLYYTTDKVKLFAEYDTSKFEEKCDIVNEKTNKIYFAYTTEKRTGQILMISVNKENKVYDITRMDATENNYKLISDICKKNKTDRRFDRYIH